MIGNYLIMMNLAINKHFNPVIKQRLDIKLKGLASLNHIHIFAMPTRIKNNDINAMFNGLMGLIKEKVAQEYSEKYLQLKLQYSRLQYLYNKLKFRLLNK